MTFSKKESETTINLPVCNIKDFSYRYPTGSTWALREINLRTFRGELVAVFGESGSGKSTLFAATSGLIPHYYRGGELAGRISLFGKDIALSEFSELASHFGIVTQNFRDQLRSNTVEGAIAFPMENQNIPYDIMRKRVDELLDLLQISQVRTKSVDELSGGQGQRVAIAAMLAKRPQMMVFDDIASDLDPKGQEDVQKIIEWLKENGITMFVADASKPKELIRSADRAVVLEQGRVVFQGKPGEIVENRSLALKIGILVPEIEFRSKRNGREAIVLEGVSYAYNGVLAVKDVSCKVVENSITGIVGHNGSGKTTLLKIIGGLYRTKEGRVVVNNINPAKTPPAKRVREVAYLSQNTTGSFFTDSVKKELEYTPREIGVQPTVTSESIGLTEQEESYPEFLSAGQRQRLAIGCALSSDPKIVLFDEPTKGLSQRERLRLVQQLLDLQQRGKTVILVSHDLQLIGRVTENILVMDRGKLVEQGATEDVLQDKGLFDELRLPLPW